VRAARSLLLAVVGVLMAASLAACTNSPSTSPPVPTQAAPASEVDGTQGFSPRGAQVTEIGEKIELWGPPQAPAPSQWVTITAIRPVPMCKTGARSDGKPMVATPKNGRILAVDMTIENGPGYDMAQPGYYAGSAQQYDWVSQDGAALDDITTYDCEGAGADAVPYSLKPGRTYKGTKFIDVPAGAGWLIFGQSNFAGPGYEFEIAAAS